MGPLFPVGLGYFMVCRHNTVVPLGFLFARVDVLAGVDVFAEVHVQLNCSSSCKMKCFIFLYTNVMCPTHEQFHVFYTISYFFVCTNWGLNEGMRDMILVTKVVKAIFEFNAFVGMLSKRQCGSRTLVWEDVLHRAHNGFPTSSTLLQCNLGGSWPQVDLTTDCHTALRIPSKHCFLWCMEVIGWWP